MIHDRLKITLSFCVRCKHTVVYVYGGFSPKKSYLKIDRVQYPEELDVEMNMTYFFSVSGQCNKGQGADCVHEEKNKFIKSSLPAGVPTTDIWQRTSRKAETLILLKRSVSW